MPQKLTNQSVRMIDGQADWAGGVNGGKTPTIVSPLNPNGLKRNQLSWLGNATCRGNGITQRNGWKFLATVSGAALYQDGWLYEPDVGDPYLVLMANGTVYRVRVDTDNSVEDLSSLSGEFMPALVSPAYMTQGEQFLVIQAGDYSTLPLFWDGITLRRSVGITDPSVPAGDPNQKNELPPAGPMFYYMGRLWYAAGRVYTAGDIVQGSSGTLAYTFRDSILKVTESPLAVGGDGFIVPTQAGNIRALNSPANLDTTTGYGQLMIFTGKSVYALQVPISRTDWTAAGTGQGTTKNPLQTVVQRSFGAIGERSIVPVNGDLFYQSADGIRSLVMAIRYFPEWGNVPISHNVNRVLQFNDRALMRTASGILFDNRLLQCALPVETPCGVAFKGLLALDFDLISTLEGKLPPAWEGMWEGLDILQLFSGDFGGRERAFAVVHSQIDDSIQVWELTNDERFENGDNRVTWFAEFPAYEWGQPTKLKVLDSAEIAIDKLYGTAYFKLEFRPDQDPCWYTWAEWSECQARTSCEDQINPQCFPYPESTYREGYRTTKTLPVPALYATCESANGRPANIGYEFQARLTIKGWCRVRRFFLHALPRDKQPFEQLITEHAFQGPASGSSPTPLPSQQPQPAPNPNPIPGQAPAVLSIINANFPAGTTGQSYSQFLQAVGGSGDYAWTITAGILPSGLSLNSATGEIHGTPDTVQTTTFTVRVSDTVLSSTVSASKTFSLNIGAPVTPTFGTPMLYLPLHEQSVLPGIAPDWTDSVHGIKMQTLGNVEPGTGLVPGFNLNAFGSAHFLDNNGSDGFQTYNQLMTNPSVAELAYLGGGLTIATWFKTVKQWPTSAELLLQFGIYASGGNELGLAYYLPAANFGGRKITMLGRATGELDVNHSFPSAGGFDPTLNEWHLVVGVYDEATHKLGISIQNTPINWSAGLIHLAAGQLAGRFYFGTQCLNNVGIQPPPDYYQCETALFNIALDQSQIDYLWNGGAGRTWPL